MCGEETRLRRWRDSEVTFQLVRCGGSDSFWLLGGREIVDAVRADGR